MKKIIKTIIFFCIILIILVVVYHFFKYKYYTFNFNTLKFPNANKTQTIIDSGGIDVTTFQIMDYNNEDIKEIIKQDFKKIGLEKINEIYEKAITGDLFKYLNEDEKQDFINNFDKEKLFNPDNYYLFCEDKESTVYEFVLFIIDTKENKLYYILSA